MEINRWRLKGVLSLGVFIYSVSTQCGKNNSGKKIENPYTRSRDTTPPYFDCILFLYTNFCAPRLCQLLATLLPSAPPAQGEREERRE